jgi:hypothetical protein
MDWFERLTGFRERQYEETRSRLEIAGGRLKSLINGKSYRVGELELVSLERLRDRVKREAGPRGRLKVTVVAGDVRQMHQLPENTGALFQVASQFNLLEMVAPIVTPEDGVTGYQYDRTQGPACAIAAGAATIYRNYFAPVGNRVGQTRHQQLNGLADVGNSLAAALDRPAEGLWRMQNGYALCTRRGLDAIAEHLKALEPHSLEVLRGKLCIGVHGDVEVTEAAGEYRPTVSQAFCSALPVAYSTVPPSHWKSFASFILEAAYEATMLAGVLNASRGASNIVLLTQLGGGAFGNADEWIHSAIRRALETVSGFDLDVRLVSYQSPSQAMLHTAAYFA